MSKPSELKRDEITARLQKLATGHLQENLEDGIYEIKIYFARCQGCETELGPTVEPDSLTEWLVLMGWTYARDSEEGTLLFCESCSDRKENDDADET